MYAMDTLAVKNTNTIHAARTFQKIMASSSSDVPSRIEILKAGTWPDGSTKGKLTITVADLHEMKNNFDAGVAMPGGQGTGLPIDFSHEEWSKAAGWIKSLEVVGSTLYAEVEWSKSGQEALQGGDFKCISPSFYPACLGEWQDYENPDITARNVLVGAGLTNIPFFKDLKPIMASTSSGGEDKQNVIYINANAKELSMTIDELRGKAVADLTDEEKAFLADHKDELTAEEKVTFGFETAEVQEPENKNESEEVVSETTNEVPADLQPVLASLKAGETVAVKASQIKAMETQIAEMQKITAAYQEKEVRELVSKHVARGAIKADKADDWTQRIIADESLKEVIADLPDHQVMADTKGSGDNAADATKSAIEQLSAKARELVKASAEAGKAITIGEALSQARKADTELAAAADKELQS